MTGKAKKKVEFGDFQTPLALARSACDLLKSSGVAPDAIVEPTCGKGSFLRASLASFPQCTRLLGFEYNPEYVRVASSSVEADVVCKDFFENDWSEILDGLVGEILVIGNPPWVTNSAIGTLSGKNLPTKANS